MIRANGSTRAILNGAKGKILENYAQFKRLPALYMGLPMDANN
jgi:hypothetical protein